MNLRRLLVDARKFLAEGLIQIGICKKIANKSQEVSDAEKELQSVVERIDQYLTSYFDENHPKHISAIFYAFQSTIDHWEEAEFAGLTTPGWYFHTEDEATCIGPFSEFARAVRAFEDYALSLDQPKEDA